MLELPDFTKFIVSYHIEYQMKDSLVLRLVVYYTYLPKVEVLLCFTYTITYF